MQKIDLTTLRSRTSYPFIRGLIVLLFILHCVGAGLLAVAAFSKLLAEDPEAFFALDLAAILTLGLGFALREGLSLAADAVDALLELRSVAAQQREATQATLDAVRGQPDSGRASTDPDASR
jgi:hypothetical protein